MVILLKNLFVFLTFPLAQTPGRTQGFYPAPNLGEAWILVATSALVIGGLFCC